MEPDQEELALTLTKLAVAVLREKSLADDLRRLTRLTARLISRSTAVSIALLVDGEPTTVAVSDRVALEVDLVQYDNSEGPCLLALQGNSVRVAHLPTDERFPHFAIGAADQRIQSVLSTPIFYDNRVIGTINTYSRVEQAFSDADADMAAIVATAAANAIAKTELLGTVQTIRDQLQAEFDEAAVVAQAQGILMAIQQCSAAQAEGIVRLAAEQNTETLIEVALRIIQAAASESDVRD
jgi:GAF domain-containing protein